MEKSLVFVIILFVGIFSIYAKPFEYIVINEFLSSNASINLDPDNHEYVDWIEIYNSANQAICLDSLYLTDNLSQPQKWAIPENTTIEAGGFLLFWADGTDNGYHTNFKLSSDGEVIALFTARAELVDLIEYPEQLTDISYGRTMNDNSVWMYSETATPGARNTGRSFQNTTRAEPPKFSLSGGFYNGSQSVELSTNTSSGIICYTTDGSIPTSSSSKYMERININSTIVIRARTFGWNALPSKVVTHTYFIDEKSALPIISIAIAPSDLWDETTGIYVKGPNAEADIPYYGANFWQDWEKPVSIEFFSPTGTLEFNFDADLKIYGGFSRMGDQKSLSIYAHEKYGIDEISYPLFEGQKQFKRFILRNRGQRTKAHLLFNDAILQTVVKDDMDLDTQAYRPAVVFLNGNYWGIMSIREKLDKYYTKYNHDMDPENVDFIEYARVDVLSGDGEHYNSFLNFIRTHDMESSENYEYIKTLIDVDEFINYQITEIYAANLDWPAYNIKYWRPRTKAGKWRWILYDVDDAFKKYDRNSIELATATDGPSWPNPPYSTLVFRKLLENPDFKNEYIQRFAGYLNTTFQHDRIIQIAKSLIAEIQPEIRKHYCRWGATIFPNVDKFADLRPEQIRQDIVDHFNLTGTAKLTLSLSQANNGSISINHVTVTAKNFTGVYFKDIPLEIKAIPLYGYRFVRWEGLVSSESESLSVILTKNASLTAVFEILPSVTKNLYINEINYKSAEAFDSGDWIELYNPKDSTVDLSGWYFKDEHDAHSFVFPDSTKIESGNYLILCNNTVTFRKLFPDVKNLIGDFNFGLSSDGELIRLFDNSGNIIDSLTYHNEAPWPSEPNGHGPTLELKNPYPDNAVAENWKASQDYGTPGKVNSVYFNPTYNQVPPSRFTLYQNYPNPFNHTTRIKFTLPKPGYVELKIYNINGQLVEVLMPETGKSSVSWNTTGLSSGIYFYQLFLNGNGSEVKKAILLK